MLDGFGRSPLDTASSSGWGECPHEPLRSPKFEDSRFKPCPCFKPETENFNLWNGSMEVSPHLSGRGVQETFFGEGKVPACTKQQFV